jgi:alpha-L-arabinofuranosidase
MRGSTLVGALPSRLRPSERADELRSWSTGFTEHMGRCIYGGILDPGNELSDPVTGHRLDVLEALKELKPPLVRYPGEEWMAIICAVSN